MNEYILLAVDYASKWIKAIRTRTNNAKVAVKFLGEDIFARFGMPWAIISDQSTHFTNKSFDTLLRRYSIVYRLATPYHPHTSGQVKVFSRQIK